MLREADEYVWAMTYQFPVLTTPVLEHVLSEGLELKIILPKDLNPPEGLRPDVFRRIPLKCVPRIDARVVVSDKEAQFGVPLTDGRVDYSAFISHNDKFRLWCLDLFEYYWERGEGLYL